MVWKRRGFGYRYRLPGAWLLLGLSLAVIMAMLQSSKLGGKTASAGPVPPAGMVSLFGAGPVRFSPPTLVDLNGDGREEILVGTADGKVFAITSTTTYPYLSILWSHDTTAELGSPTTIRGAISAADLDGDGTIEVVVPVGGVFDTNTYGGLVVLNGSDGSLRWSYRTYDHTGSQLRPDGKSDGVVGAPALGDLDNDGKLEIVFGSFDHRVYAFHYDGSMVSGWPKFVRDTVWTSPALADLDNDGLLEVIFGVDTHQEGPPFNTPNGGGLYVFHGDGRIMNGWPQFIGQTIYSSPAVGDLDGDGQLEIVNGTGDFFNNPSAGNKVYVWNPQGDLLWTGIRLRLRQPCPGGY